MVSPPSRHDALIVGAGPAGLATSRALSRRGVAHVVLERGDRLGHSWANFYRTLVLHTGKHMSALPGLAFAPSVPLFPTRLDMLTYLNRYADTFTLPIETGAEVLDVVRDGAGWRVRTRDRAWSTRALVIATGIASNPHVPPLPNREAFGGRVSHSVEYRDADPFRGRRVLVVGTGNSGGEISADLASAGVDVTVSARAGFTVLPRTIAGIPIQYLAAPLGWLPVIGAPACRRVPIIGSHMVDAIRAGTLRRAAGIAVFTADGVRFADGCQDRFDDVILATGYRAATGAVRNLIQLDDCGFARRRDRVASADHANLYFVGHNYGIRGGLWNIARDCELAAAQITATLGETSRTSTETPRRRNEK